MRDRIIRAVAAFVKKQTGSVLSVAGFTFYLTEYAPKFARPTSGDALAIDWSLWIHFRGRYWGWGSVRTLARNDDLEIWIGEHGPYTTAGNSIEFPPPGINANFEALRVKNSAPNPRAASGSVAVVRKESFFVLHFKNLKPGESSVFQYREFNADRLEIKMEPTGPAWTSKLYGDPEWLTRAVTK